MLLIRRLQQRWKAPYVFPYSGIVTERYRFYHFRVILLHLKKRIKDPDSYYFMDASYILIFFLCKIPSCLRRDQVLQWGAEGGRRRPWRGHRGRGASLPSDALAETELPAVNKPPWECAHRGNWQARQKSNCGFSFLEGHLVTLANITPSAHNRPLKNHQ